MKLIQLLIRKNGETIREVPFKDGLNLVIDETPDDKRTSSGNSIGKTTLLRAIDFCLGSTGKDIYMDKEFKIANKAVKDWLSEGLVEFILTFEIAGKKHFCLRSFDETIHIIDTIEIPKTQYAESLKELIFGISEAKPTLRQLIPKFLRSNPHKMSHVIQYLHDATAYSVYELIYLALFGFPDLELLTDRFSLCKKYDNIEKQLENYLKVEETSKLGLIKKLELIEKELSDLENKKSSLEGTEGNEEVLRNLENVRKKILDLSIAETRLQTNIDLQTSSIEDLKSRTSKEDVSAITELYKQATTLINPEDISVSLKDVIDKHNQIISNKIKFIKVKLEEDKKKINIVKREKRDFLIEQQGYVEVLNNKSRFGDLETFYEAIVLQNQKKGHFTKTIQIIEHLEDELAQINRELEIIDKKVAKELDYFRGNIDTFNNFFEDYSKRLYGERYALLYEENAGKHSFKIEGVEGNVGGGKKIGIIIAFDFAYVRFLQETGSNYCKFIIHDSLEILYNNQIETVFEISNEELDGQYIVTVLKSKIDFLGEDFIKGNKILSLSQEDRFFKF